MPMGRIYRVKKDTKPSKSVKKYINFKIQKSIETKSVPKTFTVTNIQNSTSPVNSAMTIIGQGTGQHDRIGNQIHVTGWYGQLSFFASSTDGYNSIRVIIYSPKDPTTTLTGIPPEGEVDTDQINVLYDRLIGVSYTGGPRVVTLTLRKKFNKGNKQGRVVQYHGTGSTDYAKAPLFLYAVSDSGASVHPHMTGHLRLYYKDA